MDGWGSVFFLLRGETDAPAEDETPSMQLPFEMLLSLHPPASESHPARIEIV